MGYAWLNLGGLALGGIAWALPVAALARRDKATRREAAVCSAASAASCSLALCLVVFYLGHLADRRDWSALLDTAGAFRLCAGGLFLGTLLLNALALAGTCRGRLDELLISGEVVYHG